VVFDGGAWCDNVGDGSVVDVMVWWCVDRDEDDGDDGLKMVGCGGDDDDDGAAGGGRSATPDIREEKEEYGG
ncbi:hypothetical protein Tco_1395576, partial [Tanacetum coccineum]